jgi:hypothetical protein
MGLLDYLERLKQLSSSSATGMGNLTETEARRLMSGSNFRDSINQLRNSQPMQGLGNLTEAEAARIKQLMMQRQMDEFSRQNAFMSNPQAVPYYQQTNPLGNTMTNVAPQGGGMSVRPPAMDLNSLIRMLSR